MNPDDDYCKSEGITRSLTPALIDCVHEATAECLAEKEREREAAKQAQARQIPRPIRRQMFLRREHDVAHQRLFADYFAEQPRWGPTYQRDDIGKPGLTPSQKCTVALRQLAYDITTDMFDEGVVDCQALMKMHETTHGFPRMLGSMDCMHWEWKNYPTTWRGQFTSAYKGCHPTMILKAIADHRLWIWHAYFGVAGSNNDINVLNSSNLFTEQCNGNGAIIEFTANGRQ
ncbi:uncharacterized protein LOC125220262 [Salvia hispanica]|uniref:uncharacterized protein LOC125220262 n=1 Tax=Salvia hispanica TaxID=49212 RepID=UPI002009C173|nr:uncharacterized protein LOC125220262 [Salvia hispanica]